MLSVVIIAKNESHIIGNTLESLQGLTDDIIVVDNGSTDHTISVCKSHHARVIETAWKGYGATKNTGIQEAKYDWILSLDADEAIDGELKKTLLNLQPENELCVYKFSFKNYFCNKEIRYGVWSGDKHIRLFNRKKVLWNDAEVHESLLLPEKHRTLTLKGNVLHYTVNSIQEFSDKTIAYARANAYKYFKKGKKASWFKRYLSPLFNFMQHYFFRLGFLDGWEGFLICRTNAWYTFMKYVFLYDLHKQKDNKS